MADRLMVYCNANSDEGYGHFFRCLNIVRHLNPSNENYSIAFCGNFSPLAIQALTHYEFIYYTTTLELLLNEKHELPEFRYLLFDTYKVNQQQLDKIFRLYKVIKVDDFNDYALDAAYGVINFTLRGVNFMYKTPHQLLGIDFFPYRLEAALIRKERLSRALPILKKEDQIILFFFSAKHFDIVPLFRLMECLDFYFKNCTFRLIGTGSEGLKLKNNRLEVLEPKIEIEEYYAKADLIICGGGLVKYEAAFCGIPNFSVAVTPDQHNESLYFQKHYLTYEIGTLFDFDSSYCKTRLDFFFSSKDHFENMMQGSETGFSHNKLSETLAKLIF